MALDKRICVAINNVTYKSDEAPLRITMITSSHKCNIYINLVNAVINSLAIPIAFGVSPNVGRQVNGTWTGAMHGLVNNKSEVAIGTFAATYDRFQWIQQSTILGYSSPISILYGKISRNTIHNDFHVFNTFSMDVWISIGMSIILIAIVDYYIHRITIDLLVSRIISAYASLLGQGSRHLDNYCCVKHLLILGMSLVCFMCLKLYFETYILMDQIEDASITIDSMEDLANLLSSTRSNISVVSNKRYLTWKILESSRDENFRNVYKHLLHDKDVGYDEIYYGRRIGVNYRSNFESVINANKHLGFHLSRDQYVGTPFVILYSKAIDDKIKHRIDSVINVLVESGLQDLWWTLQHERKVSVKEDRVEGSQTITMISIRGILILLFSINLLLIYILILEILVCNWAFSF